MGKPRSTVLAGIWACVLVLAAAMYLSDGGEMLSSVYRQGGWLGLLVGLYFMIRISLSAIFAVRRAARGPEFNGDADRSPEPPGLN
jgi:hypothetical protein